VVDISTCSICGAASVRRKQFRQRTTFERTRVLRVCFEKKKEIITRPPVRVSIEEKTLRKGQPTTNKLQSPPPDNKERIAPKRVMSITFTLHFVF
jgi:hypothetical protein